jgi:hypothetical protein
MTYSRAASSRRIFCNSPRGSRRWLISGPRTEKRNSACGSISFMGTPRKKRESSSNRNRRVNDSSKVCGGPRPGGAPTVCRRFGISRSWDADLPVQPRHGTRQTERGEHQAPERTEFTRPDPVRGKRARRWNAKTCPRSWSQHHQRLTLRAAGAPSSAPHSAGVPLSRSDSECCCTNQWYQRRGAIHSGSREQVRRQPAQR